jgi:hypothetical protein
MFRFLLRLFTCLFVLVSMNSCFLMYGSIDWGTPGGGQDDSDYEPVFMDRSDLESSVKPVTAQNLQKPGKIYHRHPL